MAELRKEDLWVMADKLRNNMDSAEYKHVCLGLIFLKYISDSFERAYQEISQDEYADPEDRDEYLAKNVFWVPQEARWETIKNSAKDPTIGQVIDNAMYVIEKENSSLRGVLPKDFARASLDNILEVKIKNKNEENYPVLSVVKEGEFKASEDVFTKQVYSKSTKNYKIVRRNQVAYNPARANIGSIAMLKEYDVGLVSPIYTVFEMKDMITPTFFYYYMKQPIFQEMIKHHAIGTTRQNFPFEAFKMFPMVVPPMELQLKFEEIAKPIEQKIAKLKEENEVLAEIRDTLLPKLMSGELPVEVGEK